MVRLKVGRVALNERNVSCSSSSPHEASRQFHQPSFSPQAYQPERPQPFPPHQPVNLFLCVVYDPSIHHHRRHERLMFRALAAEDQQSISLSPACGAFAMTEPDVAADGGDAGVDVDLDLPSLSFNEEDYELDSPPPAVTSPTADDTNAPDTIFWHEEKEDTKEGEQKEVTSPAQPAPPTASIEATSNHATHSSQASDAAVPAPFSSSPNASPIASTAPPPPPSSSTTEPRPSSSSLPIPSHAKRPSVIAFDGVRSTVDLGALSSSEYLAMFKAVLTLQRKCRQWRVRIKEKIRQKVESEKRRQEEEWQLKLHNIKQQRKHSQAFRLSITSHPAAESASPSPPPAQAPPPPAAARPVWSVELPTQEEERLKFTICMMKIQRAFRVKLTKARDRLKAKLQKDKEEQEREMREKIEKRKRQREEAKSMTVTTELPPLPLPDPSPLRGQLTSRSRLSHLSRADEEEREKVQTSEVEIQVDPEDLRETQAMSEVSRQALFIPLEGESEDGVGGEVDAAVEVRELMEGHLRLMAGLAAMKERKSQRRVEWHEDEFAFVTSQSLLPPQYLSSALYDRTFGGGKEGEGDDDEDWESIIHLPLPLPLPLPMT